jgi:UDP-glucose-4-epimerase GalE
MRVLVTGGAGYVGSFTARHLARCGHQVTVLDDLSEGHRAAVDPGWLVVGAISDRARLRALLDERRIEGVLHFAAASRVGDSVRDPRHYYRNNVVGGLDLLETLVEAGVSRLVFSSSCSVYGTAAEMPLREGAALAPESPYAVTKYATERAIEDFARAYGLAYALLRYFNAAGGAPDGSHGEDHQPESHLVPLALVAARDGGEIAVFGDDYDTPDGTCIRDYVHVEDLADAHEKALVRLAPGSGRGAAYNLGTGRGSSVLEVLGAVERVTGRALRRRMAPRRPGDVPRLVADPSRALAELDWKLRYPDLENIVASAWAWHSAGGRYA